MCRWMDRLKPKSRLFSLTSRMKVPIPNNSMHIRNVNEFSEAVNELTPGMRKAIELRELGERSTEETARIMGISAAAVKARVFHGRRKLRERLKHFVGSAWTYGRDASRTISNTRHISQNPAACSAGD